MSKSNEWFMQVREQELYLDSLTVAQLQSLLPANNEYVDMYIRNLIAEKQYDTV